MNMPEYDPVPLVAPERLSAPVMLTRAKAHLDLMRQRRTVRDFSSEFVDPAVIEACVSTAGSAPSGANHQPWHFVCVSDPATKRAIREAAEREEEAFYGGKAGDAWLQDIDPLGTNASKPFLEEAPWLIAVFAERYGENDAGQKRKHYYVPESVGIATGFLISALHNVGLATLTHTPNPMKFLNEILERPSRERPYVLLVVGHPSSSATVPRAAGVKKPLETISSFI